MQYVYIIHVKAIHAKFCVCQNFN